MLHAAHAGQSHTSLLRSMHCRQDHAQWAVQPHQESYDHPYPAASRLHHPSHLPSVYGPQHASHLAPFEQYPPQHHYHEDVRQQRPHYPHPRLSYPAMPPSVYAAPPQPLNPQYGHPGYHGPYGSPLHHREAPLPSVEYADFPVGRHRYIFYPPEDSHHYGDPYSSAPADAEVLPLTGRSRRGTPVASHHQGSSSSYYADVQAHRHGPIYPDSPHQGTRIGDSRRQHSDAVSRGYHPPDQSPHGGHGSLHSKRSGRRSVRLDSFRGAPERAMAATRIQRWYRRCTASSSKQGQQYVSLHCMWPWA